MLETEMLEQLKGVFERLEHTVALAPLKSSHAKQSELLEMLDQLASVSEHIAVAPSEEESAYPRFRVLLGDKPTGIAFSGIPGGHEFTSLVLAILHADHKGKLPDEGFLRRIRALKGPVKVRTYVSLSCENCPDVVQALNMMAAQHADFEHEMVDGEFVPEEIAQLGIQGVPSVVHDGELLSSGKTSLSELLGKLEEKLGSDSASEGPADLGDYDVVVIGGGPAGASSAIYTARKGLKTAIVADRLGGQLQDTKGIENMISIPYTEGPELSAHLSEHLAAYDIDILEHRRVQQVVPDDTGVGLTLASNEHLHTRALIVATGATWRHLGVPGEKDHIGRGVAFCAHCDGPFYKGKDVVVVGGGNSGVEAAIDLAAIVKSVTVVEFMPELKADPVLVKKMTALPNVSVHKNAKILEVRGNGEKVDGITYEDRESGDQHEVGADGVFVQIGLVPNSAFLEGVVERTPWGEIEIDKHGRTSAKGIYAAGDVTTVPFKQIVVAMGEGAKAGLSAFEDLAFRS